MGILPVDLATGEIARPAMFAGGLAIVCVRWCTCSHP